MSKSELLKLFKEFSFDSLKEPYIYDGDFLGIYYVVNDAVYGLLNRVFVPSNLADARWFLKNYYVYQRQGKKGSLNIVFDKYNDCFARPIFKYDLELLDEKAALDAKEYESCAVLLLKLISDKMRIILDTYDTVYNLSLKYVSVKSTLDKLLGLSCSSLKVNNNLDKVRKKQLMVISSFDADISRCYSKDDYSKVIKKMSDYLYSLETEDSFLNNKYFALKLPLDIDFLEKEIETINNYNSLSRKRRREINLDDALASLSKPSFVSLASFIASETSKVKLKYDLLSDLDACSVASYLLAYDNLDFSLPLYNVSLSDKLSSSFSSLPSKVQNNLYLLTFFQRAYGLKEMLKNLYDIVLHPSNLLVRLKMFKDVSLSSFDNFVKFYESVVYFDYPTFAMPCDAKVFFMENKIVGSGLIFASFDSVSMPRSYFTAPICYVATIKKNTPICYVPSRMVISFLDEGKLIMKDSPIIILDGKKCLVNFENSDIIRVARVEASLVKENGIVIVSKVLTKQVDCYRNVIIERK